MAKRGRLCLVLTKAQNSEFVFSLNYSVQIITLVVLDRGRGNGRVLLRGGVNRLCIFFLVSSQPIPPLVVVVLL